MDPLVPPGDPAALAGVGGRHNFGLPGGGLRLLGLSAQISEVLLRLPPLYCMDMMLKHDLGLKSYLESTTDVDGRTVYIRQATPDLMMDVPDAAINDTSSSSPVLLNGSWVNATTSSSVLNATAVEAELLREMRSSLWMALPYVACFTMCLVSYIVATCVLLLNPRQLIILYTYIGGLATLPFSFLSHNLMLETVFNQTIVDNEETTQSLLHAYVSLTLPVLDSVTSMDCGAVIVNVFVQLALGIVLGSLLRFHFPTMDSLVKVICLSFLGPVFAVIMGFSRAYVFNTMIASLIVPACLSLVVLSSAVRPVTHALHTTITNWHTFINNFGLNTFLETEWARLSVPTLLRVFWLSRMGFLVAGEAAKVARSDIWGQTDYSWDVVGEHVLMVSRDLVARGAETLVALLGMTSIISMCCHYIGSLFHRFLNATDGDGAGAAADEERSVASVSAVLFFVLSLQTGLTSLEPEKRFARLAKNLCLLLTALFHFIHNMVAPVLRTLSATHRYNSRRHIRALIICVFLTIAPTSLLFVLWRRFQVCTWLLAVSAFCIEVAVKVFVTVAVYVLFLYDQFYKAGTWESLDDSVYYVKALGNTIEFCFAVFLFFNGGWILVFESGGTVRAIMMLIHAYCNIWCEAKNGWQTFIKRRTAVSKINSLADATPEDLQEYNDVCAICYQEMTAAKQTRCKHLFHGVCLRKWLYLRDTCPLCHATLYKQQQPNKAPQQPQQGQADPAAAQPGANLEQQLNQAEAAAAHEAALDEPQLQQLQPHHDDEDELIDNDLSSDEDDHSTTSEESAFGDLENDSSEAELLVLQPVDDEDGARTDNDIIYDNLEDFDSEDEGEEEDGDTEEDENMNEGGPVDDGM